MWRIIFQSDRSTAEKTASLWGESLFPEAQAVSIFESRDNDIWRVDALYEQECEATSALDLLSDQDRVAASLAPVQNEDWVAMSLKGLEPIRAGCFIVHGQHAVPELDESRIGILIEAGQAFGTGHHGTTQGCLQAIDTLSSKRTFSRALDLGCGTGVLAMAMSKRMGIPVTASDLDPIAIETAKANAEVNACADNLTFAVAPGVNHDTVRGGEPYDLVVANILMGPLLEMAHDIRSICAPGGTLVLSGILEDQSARVIEAYEAEGFHVDDQLLLDGWSTLTLIAPEKT